ncbi:predicted protein [Plenodomus lingam JN3]|uniref:Predicted protein n=1 Tax=Leptosphaeria maculans (strain JN3 / isolate v23.1.3 / race Av1-4-5-6-7-8) TaxID=985895 RepID=E4ZPS6_LEPMJ|nr:predicted protein [Plenodomus lingam JN3]CBX93461.1 predicted protein [Plenodomus lingam JN3]
MAHTRREADTSSKVGAWPVAKDQRPRPGTRGRGGGGEGANSAAGGTRATAPLHPRKTTESNEAPRRMQRPSLGTTAPAAGALSGVSSGLEITNGE